MLSTSTTANTSYPPLTTDAAVIEPLSLSVQTYATQLRTLITAIQTFDTRMAAVFPTHADRDIFGSVPGADVCAPRLAAAFGTDRSRWRSSAELQAHSGIAPVTERSGKTIWVHHRLACPTFVKQTFHEFADQSIRFSRWPVRTTINSALAAVTTTPRYALWRTNGFGFCLAAGKSTNRTTKTSPSVRFAAADQPSRNNLLATQMSMPPLPMSDAIS